MEKSNFAIWLAVNEDGDAAVSMDGASQAKEAVGAYGGAVVRCAKISVAMMLPKILNVDVEVPDEDEKAEAEPGEHFEEVAA